MDNGGVRAGQMLDQWLDVVPCFVVSSLPDRLPAAAAAICCVSVAGRSEKVADEWC